MDAFFAISLSRILLGIVLNGHSKFLVLPAMFQDIDDYQDSSSSVTFAVIVATMLIGFATIVPVIIFTVRTIKNSMENSRLLQTGEAAQAMILKIWETGVTVNNDPQIGMLVEVAPEGQSAYQTEIKSIVSILKIPLIQPGATVAVRFDRENPLKVALAI